MGKAITEPDRRRQRGCALGSAGHLRVVLEGASCAHPAERQGTVPVLTGVEGLSTAFGATRRTSWRPWSAASSCVASSSARLTQWERERATLEDEPQAHQRR